MSDKTAKKPAKRRIGAESSATRAAILEATNAVIRDEGYAAASTRRIAARAGLKPSLVHYYFPTTEDLLMAVMQAGAAESDAWLEGILNGPQPLQSLWRFFCDTSRNELSLEMMAMANHRPVLKAAIKDHSERMRARQIEVIETVLGQKLINTGGMPPAGVALVLAGIGRALMMEGGLGVSSGHKEAAKWVENWLAQIVDD
jgi:AcrR family transcriptional regulator